MSTHLPRSLFDLYRRAIEDYCGICLSDDHRLDLENKILQRMEALGLDSPMDYLKHLTTMRSGHREWDDFIALIANNETFFFREPVHFEVLQQKILPELVRRRRQIRVWSAGCSTGEEAYSLAIALYESRLRLGEFEPAVIGTDIDQAALDVAQRGEYGKNSFRSVDPEMIARYFPGGDESSALRKIDPRIRQFTSFRYLNLIQPSYGPEFSNFDVIFFRNVSIYFSKETIARIHRRLMDALSEGGCLFVASSETLHHQFDVPPVEVDGVFLFRKEMHAPVRARPTTKKSAVSHPPARTAQAEPSLEEIVRAYHDGHYAEVLSMIDRVRSDRFLKERNVLKTLVYVGQEKWLEAEEMCETMLAGDAIDPEAHLLKGMIARHQSRTDDAEASFRRSLFLNGDLAVAHFYLGKLLTDIGRREEAQRSFRNAVRVLDHKTDRSTVFMALGYSPETLRGACQRYLSDES
jgi:chemotaxis protein methyltransferase CheR